MRRIVICLISLTFILLLLVSCSSSDSNIVTPDTPAKNASMGNNSHSLMGLWQFVWDPETETLDYYQLRTSDLHLNVLPFLEPAPLLFLTIEGGIIYDVINNTIQVDIGLIHPFAGLNEFAGFDVKGIVISRHDLLDATPSRDLKMPGPTTLRLLNADGYTRMWNPDEFPYDPDNDIFTYKDGLLGAPDEWANYDAQINGYKYYCDGLLPAAPVTDMTFTDRGVFGPGSKNVRRFLISNPQGLIFNYAVDASWEFPSGGSPWTYPDDYSLSANSPEAYHIECIIEGTMFSENAGSDMTLYITAYDHQPGSITDVYVEAKDLYFAAAPADPAVWHAAYQGSTTFTDVYSVQIENVGGVAAGIYPALIYVVDEERNTYLDPVSVEPVYYTAYKLIDIEVTTAPGVYVTLEEDAQIKGLPSFNSTFIYDAAYFTSTPVHIVDYTDGDGPWQFSYAYTDTATLRSLPLGDSEVSGFVGQYPPEITHFYTGVASYGLVSFEPYIGEQHDFTDGKRKVYGVTDINLLLGTFIFSNQAGVNVPMEFEYPYYYGTDFTTNGQYILPGPVPIEVFEVIWKVKGLGDGNLTLTPGGTTYPALLMKHEITLELSNTVIANALIYEWLHDDGTPLAYIVSANAPLLGWGSNYDPATGIIHGESLYHILQGY